MESMVDSRAQQVQRWLDARGHSYRWLADKIGRNHQSVTDYVQGKTRPRDESVWDQIAQVLREQERLEAERPVIVPDSRRAAADRVARLRDSAAAWANLAIVPLRNWRSANAHGQGIAAMFELDGLAGVPSVFLVGGESAADRHDVVRVSGDSLSPRVESGERLVFYRDPTLHPNSIVLAVAPDGVAYTKVLRRESDGWRLRPVNPAGESPADLDGWTVLGYAVARLGSESADDGEGFNVEWRGGSPLRVAPAAR